MHATVQDTSCAPRYLRTGAKDAVPHAAPSAQRSGRVPDHECAGARCPGVSTPAGGVTVAVVLIVEDDRIMALDLQRHLARRGHTVLPPVSTAEAALAAVRAHRPGLVLMDVGLSGGQDGLTAGRAIQAMGGTPVIYLSGHVPAQLTAYAGGTGPTFYLLKPVTPAVVARTVEQVLAYAAHQHTVQVQQDVIDTLQRTRALRATMQALRQATRESREAAQRRCRAGDQAPPATPTDPEEGA